MLNKKLIAEALEIISSYYEDSGIAVNTQLYRDRLIDWYNHSDITDAETLAAVAMETEYDATLKWNDIEHIWNYYFGYPDDIIADYLATSGYDDNNINVEELKLAQEDVLYYE